MQVNGSAIHFSGCVASAASLQYYLTANLSAACVLLRSFYVTYPNGVHDAYLAY